MGTATSNAGFSLKSRIRNFGDLLPPSQRLTVFEIALHPSPGLNLRKGICSLPSENEYSFLFYFFLPSFLCVLMHSNTRLFPKHSSFVYLSIPITDLCLSGCSDHTFPRDHSLHGDTSARVGVFQPLALCKVTELPH